MPRFGTSYRAKVTFGLHVGWAIEGSIGTDQKIDALLVSADTQIAQRVEELNEQYGTRLLMTGQLHELLSDFGKKCTQQIDRILIEQSLG